MNLIIYIKHEINHSYCFRWFCHDSSIQTHLSRCKEDINIIYWKSIQNICSSIVEDLKLLIFELIFYKIIHHWFSNENAMFIFDAFMPHFHHDFIDNCFQCDHVFFSSFDWFEYHQFAFNNDRIQYIIQIIDFIFHS